MLLRIAALAVVLASMAAAIPVNEDGGVQWALLIAGSSGFGNYRHQADIYHAYQIMKRGGIPDERIVVMHYDDIANARANPHKGQVFNDIACKNDVYAGVPKDYVGRQVTKKNFFAALAGDAKATEGGSGKVIASGPNDDVFVYFADHGGPGMLGMPTGFLWGGLYAKELNNALKAKAAAKGFRQLVFYVEACESGSIFEDQLPANISIYATTAANGQESSWGCYCPGMNPAPPKEMTTCLGDLYSVAWMEDTDANNRASESWLAQFTKVANRVSQNGTYSQGSHVQQFGELSMDSEMLSDFIGSAGPVMEQSAIPATTQAVNQRDADLIHLRAMVANAAANSAELAEAQAALDAELIYRRNTDTRFVALAEKLAGANAATAMNEIRKGAVVDDWECYMGSFKAYEDVCGAAGQYAMKYGRLLANLCNAGVQPAQITAAAEQICK